MPSRRGRVVVLAATAVLIASLLHAGAGVTRAADSRDVNSLGLAASYDVDATFDWRGRTADVKTTATVRGSKPWSSSELAFNLQVLRIGRADVKAVTIDGRPVTLGDVATFDVVEKPQEIQRQDRKVRVAVRATYEGKSWDEVRKKIEGLMDAFALPPGYSWSWNDRILEQDTQGQQMGINMLLALVLVYLIMAALFESLAQPFAILFSIPFALPGTAWLLAATRTPFNLMSQIGLMILMGIVVNNGIVLLDHMNQLRREGLERDAAILQAGRDRLRAILMTASTTIIGLLPLAIGGSKVGGLFYYPLAITVMGGLMSSSLLTLLVLPYVNVGVEGFANWLRTVWTSAKAIGSPRTLPAAQS